MATQSSNVWKVSAAHGLKLSYRSKCENLHGRNWIITALAAVPKS